MSYHKQELYEVEEHFGPANVCVTGATGFVAGPIVRRLLLSGHTVHATVRNPDSQASKELMELPGAAERLKLFKADLLAEGAFDEAMAGCDYVMHTASPFIANVPKNKVQEMLLNPALKGTENVLASVNKTPSVKRVILTSSCAAIYGHATERGVGYTFTEEDWNQTATDKLFTYSYSKTIAERRAWEIAKEQDRWELVTINPALVLGPPNSTRADGESITIMKRILKKEMSSACPQIGLGIVDVRDVAAAHCLAMCNPKASGRYITVSTSVWMADIVRSVSKQFGIPAPSFTPPKWLMRILGPLMGIPSDFVRFNVGPDAIALFNNTKIQSELGLVFRGIDEMVRDMSLAMHDHKLVVLDSKRVQAVKAELEGGELKGGEVEAVVAEQGVVASEEGKGAAADATGVEETKGEATATEPVAPSEAAAATATEESPSEPEAVATEHMAATAVAEPEPEAEVEVKPEAVASEPAAAATTDAVATESEAVATESVAAATAEEPKAEA